MPRLARAVFANVPHHITQRGNRRENVFFSEEDFSAYLGWLKDYCNLYGVEVLAYCLMTNHVHLVAVPLHQDSLQLTLRPLHTRYAQRINKMKGWKGHVWQGRFFSTPLDERYMWAAIHYVELNPVRAHIVKKAEDYQLSSAAYHCGYREDDLLVNNQDHPMLKGNIDNWSAWLEEGERPDETKIIRRNIEKGLPCGSSQFIHELEKDSGRSLSFQPQGRPIRKRVTDLKE